ncbi:GNAT family N-acetyltransferase [Hamadaea tsunoensis]|uniref:GNAT family N-acetyltransferase n=1 Tax=Hamadaea tsunoensis TaxID=53368 RepID=UPI00040AB6DB|nr:GNAT family N-acetyltransferase [Hamadaea tsunoensis]
MTVRELTDRAEALALLRRHPERHLLGLGDLDDAFWPDTRVLAGYGQAIVIYTGLSEPVVLAVADPAVEDPAVEDPAAGDTGDDGIARLAAEADLPPRFYSHLSPAAAAALRDRDGRARYHVAVEDEYALMSAPGATFTGLGEDLRVSALTASDLPDIQELQDEVHPGGGFFEAIMLRSGPYRGLRLDGRLVAMAGCHVFSRQQRVAVLGNIATRPAYRRRGLAEAVTARLCADLAPDVDLVGLTVSTANAAAVGCYRKLGFTTAAQVLGARCTLDQGPPSA